VSVAARAFDRFKAAEHPERDAVEASNYFARLAGVHFAAMAPPQIGS
jgi:hypothetical protein